MTENTRVTRMVSRLGFVSVGSSAGPAWIATRGWSQTEWRLTRTRWEATEAGKAIRATRESYFSIGNSTKKLADFDRYVRLRLWRFLKKQQGPRGRLRPEAFVEWERRSGLTYFYPTGR